ncbi:PREDICTED: uncharacterized protein LOC109472107, partial [Branchiostoma belcheri]|uniref:Uncharacterized protein LOC109472107 n=1 Tax=Branchiostoma belcheri TaxID=7741 RepID=A0A6P4Z849_BRABE
YAVFSAHCEENDIQPITPVPERELPEGARPAPLHRKRPWRRLTTADSHQPRVPSRARKTKGAKPRRPARLAPTNRGGIDAPETDEIACVCGVNEESDEVFVNCVICGRWSHTACYGLGDDVTKFVCWECGDQPKKKRRR